MTMPILTNSKPYIYGFLIALGGALLARQLHFPLPWLIGPLIATAITTMLGMNTKSHPNFRRFGQWVIGTSLGLYFTPQTLQAVLHFSPYILLGCLFALLLSFLNMFVLHRWAKADLTTAWFAGAVGGASEMANLAERYQARVDSVASSHSVRVLVVVLIIPFSFQFLGIKGDFLPPTAIAYHFNFLGLLALMILSLLGIKIFQKLHIPNPWVLGPLSIALLLTSQNIHLTHLSPFIQSLGQLCIGWSLGSKYDPDFFSRAPRYLTVSASLSVFGLLLSIGVAYLLAVVSPIPLSTLVLGLSPGGIAEMTITAKALMLGVPIVAAFHVSRMIFILLLAHPCYTCIEKYFIKAK